MKKLIAFVSFALALALLASCASSGSFFQVRDPRSLRKRVFDYVFENEALLIDCIRERTLSRLENSGIIEDIYEHETCIEFSCGASGFGSNTSYWGFYYVLSENAETAVRAFFDYAELTESGSGLEMREESGDDYFYTENITGRFYYYFQRY